MPVEPVQVYHPETPAAEQRRQAPQAAAPGGTPASSTGPMTPRDEVVVSDQARRLASGGAEAARLQLDFKQLRELAFERQSQQAAGSTE